MTRSRAAACGQRYWRHLTVALFALALFHSVLYAGPHISTHVDSRGRVVFVNEGPLAAEEAVAAADPQEQPLPPAPAAKRLISSTRPSKDHIDNLIESTASHHQVDPDLIRAIVQVESNFNPYAVSTKGAKGLMQLIPATAQRFGVSNSFDPQANLDGGIRYLKYLMEMFKGDLQLSLAAYNAGENRVGRYRRVPPIPETRDYVRKIAQLYSVPRSPSPAEPPQILKFVDDSGIVHFSNTDQ